MIYPTPKLDPSSELVLARLDELKKRLRSALSEPVRWEGLLRRTTFAKAIRGSNTIEGYNVTVDDAIAAIEGESPLSTDEATWAEIIGYRQAMTYVIQLAKDPHFGYSADILKSLHYMLLSHDLSKGPGQWRPGDIFVREESTGEIVYEGPDAGLVPSLVAELVEALNLNDQTHVVVRAAMAHLNLTMIHPFRDGNGRMARCLQTLVLARGGTISPVFSSIEEYLGHNTKSYYDILATTGQGQWSPERDSLPWVRFCLTAHFRQAMTVLNRIDRIRRLWDALEKEVLKRRLPDRAIYALADAAQGLRVRNPTYRKAADISSTLASRDLQTLAESGLLIPHGEKKGRFYLAGPVVKTIRNAADVRKRPIEDPFAQLSLELPDKQR